MENGIFETRKYAMTIYYSYMVSPNIRSQLQRFL